MFKTLYQAFKTKDVRNKILFIIFILFVFRLGCWLPIPGINADAFKTGVDNAGFLSLLSGLSGGALKNGAVLALGVVPYINASIIMQLLTFVVPHFERLSKQGDEGRKKLNLYTRILCLVMCVAQAVGIVIAFSGNGLVNPELWKGAPSFLTGFVVVIVLVAGGMFTMWLGERITKTGTGEGLSLLIFVGILSTAGWAIFDTIGNIAGGGAEGTAGIWTLVVFLVAVVLVCALIVFVSGAERKIPVQYANQMRGRKMYGGQSTHIPMKINATGVLPIIFAMALLQFPGMIIQMTGQTGASNWYQKWLGAGSWIFIAVSSVLIMLFTFFYAKLMFNPADVTRNIQQNGGFIPGIRPGKPTEEYLGKVNTRLTLFGALFLTFLNLVPSLVFKGIGVGGSLITAFTATGLLIVVSVALEFEKHIEGQLLMRSYKGFLK